jgi:hypothetical protein
VLMCYWTFMKENEHIHPFLSVSTSHNCKRMLR